MKLHKTIESNSALLIFGILVVASIGGLVQILPNLFDRALHTPAPELKPYGALALTGRDLYIREGCVGCHSQQIRPLTAEVMRYGARSTAAEAIYDRPFLWGSKRTGPDLARLGGKYSDAWHRIHLLDPRAVVPGSIMPAYAWLADAPADAGDGAIVAAKMRALRRLGHPYSDADLAAAADALAGKSEMDALIAYLQSLGAR
ncbi:MAG: cytochrome-c oxidase, cbb3-type subunit II [bacterium]